MDQINSQGRTIFLIIFAVLIAISSLAIVSVILATTCCNDSKFFRGVIHFIWNFTSLIMIITFLIGGLFGLVGLVSVDGVNVLQFLFGKDNLTKNQVLIGGSASQYLDVCINGNIQFNFLGNGDLADVFNLKSGDTSYVDTLYAAAQSLSDVMNQINNNSNSQAITEINIRFGNFSSDITQTTDSVTHGNNDLTYVFNQWQGWTDSNQNMYQKGCSSNTKDQWVQNQNKCSSGYTYIASGSSSIGSNYCAVYPEWTSSQVSSRYSSQPSGCSASGSTDFASVQSAATNYYDKVTLYTTSNTNLLNKMTSTNNDLNSSFQSMAKKLSTSISNISGILNPLVKIFNDILGTNGFFSLINCCK